MAEVDAGHDRKWRLTYCREKITRLPLLSFEETDVKVKGAKEQAHVVVCEALKQPEMGRKKQRFVPLRQPKTAYNIMCMSKCTEPLATYQISQNECSAMCGRLWRQMSEPEREPYQHMAAEDKNAGMKLSWNLCAC